ncbi:hypothetical protein HBA92_07280 [Ochrobactrum sp. MR28]|nr:hypothetical protein [Ochrobactrum sp. MR28]MBX8816129.1 hypothetical protein [Ochrobactrum sp. MR31]
MQHMKGAIKARRNFRRPSDRKGGETTVLGFIAGNSLNGGTTARNTGKRQTHR